MINLNACKTASTQFEDVKGLGFVFYNLPNLTVVEELQQ
jgi:hypothetical protein